MIEIGENSDIYVDGKTYAGTPGLYELITRKKVSKSLITTRDLNNYRCNLEASSVQKNIIIPSDLKKRHVVLYSKTSSPTYFLPRIRVASRMH